MKTQGVFDPNVILVFTNITDKEFKTSWDGNVHTFTPGESRPLPEYLAYHHAKHLIDKICQDTPAISGEQNPQTGKAENRMFDEAFRTELEGQILTPPKRLEDVSQVQLIEAQEMAKATPTLEKKVRQAKQKDRSKLMKLGAGHDMVVINNEDQGGNVSQV